MDFRATSYPHKAKNSQYHDQGMERLETLEEMGRLKTVLEATRLVLDTNPAGIRHALRKVHVVNFTKAKTPQETPQVVVIKLW